MIHTRVTTRLFALLVAVFVVGCATSPPVQEMSDARQAIVAAEDADAARLAPAPLDDARRFLSQAETQIRDRSFTMARSNAIRAKNRAVDALQASQEASRSADN
jgi:F0F1-type ATP synthase membrane subunit b/b'